MTIRARPVTVSGTPATVRARATATLDFAGSSLQKFSRDCPILIYAYRDRARRDAAPRSGAADWTQPATCSAEHTTAPMQRGGTQSFDTSAPARTILGASLPSGKYYFAISVGVEGSRVFLSAGEADLRR